MLDLLKPFAEGFKENDASPSTPKARSDSTHFIEDNQSLEDKPTSVVTDAGRDALTKETKSKKGIIASQPRGNHNVYTHYPKDPLCEVCKMTTTTCMDGAVPTLCDVLSEAWYV